MPPKKKVKVKKVRNEIRMVGITDDLLNAVTEMADANKRTIGKQAEFMLEKCVKENLEGGNNG